MSVQNIERSAENWKTLGWVWVVSAAIVALIVANALAQVAGFFGGFDSGVFVRVFVLMFVGSLVTILPYFGISRLLEGLADTLKAVERVRYDQERAPRSVGGLPREAASATRQRHSTTQVRTGTSRPVAPDGITVERDGTGTVRIPAVGPAEAMAIVDAALQESWDEHRSAAVAGWIQPRGQTTFDMGELSQDDTLWEVAIGAIERALHGLRIGDADKVELVALSPGLSDHAATVAEEMSLRWAVPDPGEFAAWHRSQK